MRPVVLLFVLGGLALTLVSWSRHGHLGSATFDLAIQHQTVWLLAQGEEPYLTTRGIHAFGDHFNPLATAVPGLLAWSPLPLLALQAFLLAAGAIPVYALARRRLGETHSLLLAAVYLVHPYLLYQNRFDFHFNGLIVPFALGALWALEAELWGYYALALVLVLYTGESAAPSLGLLALLIWPWRGWRWSALTLGLAAAGSAAALASLHHYSGGEPTQYLSLYHRLRVDSSLFTWSNLVLLASILSSLAWLPLLSPLRLLPALPFLLGNLLSWREYQHGLEHHYGAGLMPFLMWAAIGGAQRLAGLVGSGVTTWLLVLGVVQSVLLGPLAPWNDEIKVRAPQPGYEAALQVIGRSASVSADNVLGAQLAGRHELYLFPNPFQVAAWGNRAQALAEQTTQGLFPSSRGALRRAIEQSSVEYVALDLAGETFPLGRWDRWYLLTQLLHSGRYGVNYFDGRFLVLRRGLPPGDIEAILRKMRPPWGRGDLPSVPR